MALNEMDSGKGGAVEGNSTQTAGSALYLKKYLGHTLAGRGRIVGFLPDQNWRLTHVDLEIAIVSMSPHCF